MRPKKLGEGEFLPGPVESFSGLVCHEVGELQPGSILVKKDTGLVPGQFHGLIAGVVATCGTENSHFAIHLAESGVPCVVLDGKLDLAGIQALEVVAAGGTRARVSQGTPPPTAAVAEDRLDTGVRQVDWDRVLAHLKKEQERDPR